MKTRLYLLLCLTVFYTIFPIGYAHSDTNIARNCNQIDAFTIEGEKDFVHGYSAFNEDGTINVVVEIPAGTTEKWEVNGKLKDGSKPTDGKLRWEFKKGKPRIVKYIGYPGNYGFIPGTLGGDDDPLDILLLGRTLQRGSVVRAKYIGVLKMLDDDEVDDKIIGVFEDSHLYHVDDINELDNQYAGVSKIIVTWFTNYKGPGEIISTGWAEREAAKKIIQTAEKNYRKKH